MSKPQSERTHAKRIKSEQTRKSPETIRSEKNAKTKSRGLERKAANIAKRVGTKRTPAEQLARLNTYGYAAVKERKRLEKKLSVTS